MSLRRLFSFLFAPMITLFDIHVVEAQQEDNPAYFDVSVKADVHVPFGAYNGGGSSAMFGRTGHGASSLALWHAILPQTRPLRRRRR